MSSTIASPTGPPPRGSNVVRGVLVLTVLGGLLAIGILPRIRQHDAVAAASHEAAAPRRVVVGTANPVEGPFTITLPGSANPFRITGVYAKASGFVRKVHVELGDRVKAGQLLVELEIPETDEELRRVRAQVEEAEANVGLFDSNAARNDKLGRDGIVSTLASEQARQQANTARAAAKTSRAELQRVAALQGYRRIVAPFSGVVSRRIVEPGQLVTFGSGAGALLVEIADTDRLRVLFDVPQVIAADLEVGQKAIVFSPSDPARAVEANVVRTAGSLDTSTRTLRAEVDLDGKAGIFSGAFVSVKLSIPRKRPVIMIPASALSIRKEGPLVARVTGDKIAWVPVTIGRDLGKELEIVTGVAAKDRLVLNAPDDLREGEAVRVTDREAK